MTPPRNARKRRAQEARAHRRAAKTQARHAQYQSRTPAPYRPNRRHGHFVALMPNLSRPRPRADMLTFSEFMRTLEGRKVA